MIESLIEITQQAGRIAHGHFGKLAGDDVFHKSSVDMVTRIDRELEEFLQQKLGRAFPGVAFYGEEGDYGSLAELDRVFVVDPLDGTTSYIHGHPFYSVSVGLREGGQTTAGVVYLPYFDQTYWAVRGQGAFHDGERLHVSPTDQLIDSLAATGFACVRARLARNNLPLFTDVMPRIRGIRRCGSAAIDLCYVADGTYDLYWEYQLQPWDIEAGALILDEAGGRVSDLAGTPDYEGSRHFLASNGRVHDEFLAISRGYVEG
jgi:myo-inositol-1(or 4)-monophosphatase